MYYVLQFQENNMVMDRNLDIHENIYTSVFMTGYKKHSLHHKVGLVLHVCDSSSCALIESFSVFKLSTHWNLKKRGFYIFFLLHRIMSKICLKLNVTVRGMYAFRIVHSKITPFGPVKLRIQLKWTMLFYHSILNMLDKISTRVLKMYNAPKTLDLIRFLIKIGRKSLLKYNQNK